MYILKKMFLNLKKREIISKSKSMLKMSAPFKSFFLEVLSWWTSTKAILPNNRERTLRNVVSFHSVFWPGGRGFLTDQFRSSWWLLKRKEHLLYHKLLIWGQLSSPILNNGFFRDSSYVYSFIGHGISLVEEIIKLSQKGKACSAPECWCCEHGE